MGIIPDLLTRPSVGFTPTIPTIADGQTIDPSVSVPIANAVRLAATAPADPELDPHGFRSSPYGFFACPPRPLHPLDERVDLKFAPSLMLALPRSMAPASRRRWEMNASRSGIDPSSA